MGWQRVFFGVSLLLLVSFSPSIVSASQVPIAYGDLVTGTIGAVGERDTFTFSGTAGDVVTVRMNRSTPTLGCWLEVYRPDGSMLAAYDGSLGESRAWITMQLDVSGTYTVLTFDNDGNETGDYALSLQSTNLPGNSQALSYGELVTGSLPNLSQMKAYRFSGQANDWILVRMNRTTPDLSCWVEVYRPDGSMLAAYDGSLGDSRAWITTQLDVSGTYTVLAFDNDGNEPGDYALSLQCTNQPGNPQTIGYGDLTMGSLANLTQMKTYQFTGTAGDWITARMNRTTPTFDCWIELYRPDGSPLGWSSMAFDGYRAWGSVQLDVSGTYTLLVFENDGDQTGDYALSLQSTNHPGNTQAISYGDLTMGSLANLTQMKTYQFTGTAGDWITARMNRTTATFGCWVEIYRPDGSALGWQSTAFDGYRAWGSVQLDVSGTFTILAFDDDGTETGDFALSLQSVNRPGNTRAVSYGELITDELTHLSQMRTYQLTAAAGDLVGFQMVRRSGDLTSWLEVYSPDGTYLAASDGSGGGVSAFDFTFGTGGTYTILAFDSDGSRTGEFWFIACHCTGTSGNIDGDPDGVVDISDLAALVDFLFGFSAAPVCTGETDVNKDGGVDISDLQYLIDYLFFESQPLLPCP